MIIIVIIIFKVIKISTLKNRYSYSALIVGYFQVLCHSKQLPPYTNILLVYLHSYNGSRRLFVVIHTLIIRKMSCAELLLTLKMHDLARVDISA